MAQYMANLLTFSPSAGALAFVADACRMKSKNAKCMFKRENLLHTNTIIFIV